MLKVNRTPEGRAYLHLWREGDEYLRQKGERLLRDWTNVRFVKVPKRAPEAVHHVDLSREPLEFPDQTFDAANAYHVLEHLTPEEGARLVTEVFRVLKPGGIFRASVPDLEGICREYLAALEEASRDPSVANLRRYRWTVMEIFEQMVREKTGGRMLDALLSGDYDREHIEGKYADVFGPILASTPDQPVAPRDVSRDRPRALRGHGPRSFYRGLRRRVRAWIYGDLRHPAVTGERARWMYDRVSLSLLLQDAGFVGVRGKDFRSSDIPHWDRYDLDRSNHSDRPIDPSVYVEARRPDRGVGFPPPATLQR